ncbi:MAG: ATP-binding protein [Chloroflexi bacterium]|nr:ATP-binding protein [Chloroflexota bacterium]
MAKQNERFTFDISLSVLNHLGRNLYRSFVTVLGEAISNAWDADAENVWIYIDKDADSFVIKDDGQGMNAEDFQSKFLKIGYSKRKDSSKSAQKGRPFIGRKGIGKLALLSCAETITVISRMKNGEYVGGVIDNSDLDQAIMDDLSSRQYQLGLIEYDKVKKFTANHSHGTIVYFENIKEGIRKSIDHLKKLVALNFRFSLLDESFNIWLDGELITHENLGGLADHTQFLWTINEIDDPYLASLKNVKKKYKKKLQSDLPIRGFIASVEKPLNLKIMSTEEKAGVDLLVNGRLREKDILKHIPTARIVESYLYGQIHFDGLDEESKDRFTSSREGIIADDDKFQSLLSDLRNILLPQIIEDWDVWRIEIGREGDDDNPRLSKKARKSRALYSVVSEEYSLPEEVDTKDKVGQWVKDLADDAQFNFSSYAECFVSENLIRKYIEDKKIPLSKEAQDEVDTRKKNEDNSKNIGNVSIDIRKSGGDLGYLSMDFLAYLVDKDDPVKKASLSRDAKEYKPMRDALAHTSLLTDLAKNKLTTVYENIKGRLRTLLSSK